MNKTELTIKIKKSHFAAISFLLVILCLTIAWAETVPNIFTPGQQISSSQMNNNFSRITERIDRLEESKVTMTQQPLGVRRISNSGWTQTCLNNYDSSHCNIMCFEGCRESGYNTGFFTGHQNEGGIYCTCFKIGEN